MWFTEFYSNKIGRITTTGQVTEFNIPTANAGAFGITAGPDGALWFTELTAGTIGRITTSGIVTEYVLRTTAPRPAGITTGADGALWFTESNINKIGRITTSGAVSEYFLPSSNRPSGIAAGPDGALWFAENDKIGRAELPKSRTGSLSHIAAGSGWVTEITLVNTSSATIPVTVVFRNNDGIALTLPVTTTQYGRTETATTSSVTATISPNTSFFIAMGAASSSLLTGWAEILSPGPVGGFAIFRDTPPTGTPSEGTVPLQTQFTSTIDLAYDNAASFVMGVAIANLSSTPSTVTATIWDESGTLLGAPTFQIAGNGHTSFVLPTQFTMTLGRRGIVRFQSSGTGGLDGLGLRFSPFNTFTSVPTMR